MRGRLIGSMSRGSVIRFAVELYSSDLARSLGGEPASLLPRLRLSKSFDGLSSAAFTEDVLWKYRPKKEPISKSMIEARIVFIDKLS